MMTSRPFIVIYRTITTLVCRYNMFYSFSVIQVRVKTNVLKIGPVTESEKLPVHGSLVGPMVEPWLNR